MKNIYLIIGESGSGKSTIAKHLSENYGMKEVQSYTTRQPRYKGETGHIFMPKDYRPNSAEYVAHTLYNGNHYWASSEQVDNNDLYVIDLYGLEMMSKLYKGKKGIKVVKICSSKEDRYSRMLKRGDSVLNAKERLYFDELVFEEIKYDLSIINTDIDKAVKEVFDFISESEK